MYGGKRTLGLAIDSGMLDTRISVVVVIICCCVLILKQKYSSSKRWLLSLVALIMAEYQDPTRSHVQISDAIQDRYQEVTHPAARPSAGESGERTKDNATLPSTGKWPREARPHTTISRSSQPHT